MWLLFALVAALLTSFLPIVNKRLLSDTPVSVVAWGVNALSLPLLGVASLLLLPVPQVDGVFWLGILGSALLNLVATLMSTQALKLGDASLVTPFLTFNPAFTLLVAVFTLSESPTTLGVAGVLVVLGGGYLLNLHQAAASWWAPLRAMLTEPAILLAIGASLVWGLTPITEKLAMQHSSPPNPPLVAFGSTALMSLFLLPGMLRQVRNPLGPMAAHGRGFLLAAAIAGVAPIFGFTAIGLGLVGYVSAIFKLSTVFSVAWAFLVLKEEGIGERLAGSAVMVLGAVLIAL
ncbi:MAG: EamA family transporter [Chloroflexi bacterium]|nr:EamA family transporter [Chloroflexota bacterium]